MDDPIFKCNFCSDHTSILGGSKGSLWHLIFFIFCCFFLCKTYSPFELHGNEIHIEMLKIRLNYHFMLNIHCVYSIWYTILYWLYLMCTICMFIHSLWIFADLSNYFARIWFFFFHKKINSRKYSHAKCLFSSSTICYAGVYVEVWI